MAVHDFIVAFVGCTSSSRARSTYQTLCDRITGQPQLGPVPLMLPNYLECAMMGCLLSYMLDLAGLQTHPGPG